MTTPQDQVAYLVFDVEAAADGGLISRVRYPNEELAPEEAIQKYREELLEQTGKDVIPPTFMLPISVAVAKVDGGFKMLDLTTLDEPDYQPYQITRKFWQGYLHYGTPTLVTFNGRGYDLPVLELAAYRYGLSLPQWFNVGARTYDQSRNRYNIDAHIDLMDLLSNFGASRVTGGLNLLANLIGKPGKTGIDGSQVQGMYDRGEVQAINDYCRSDVLDTYFVFLRTRVLLGQLTLEEEHELVEGVKAMLEGQASESAAYQNYLEHWGDWQRPE
jgi:predicted PolB exonuclease-like 3'-5' exonuclease